MTLNRFAIAAVLGSVFAATAVDATVIGVVAPKSGPYALLGNQVFEGARAAAGGGERLVEIDETCETSTGAALADQLAAAKVEIAIGFLCVETLTEGLPVLKKANIPAVSISVRSKILMEDVTRENWPFFRMAPVESDEAERLAEVILADWKAQPVALIEDGTIYGRELASEVRGKLEAGGIAPVFTDTFRPGQEQQVALVRRLSRAGATHVFIGGDRNDTAIIARDASAENIPLAILGGDTLRAADRPVALREGVLAAALPNYAVLPEATAAVTALRARNIEPEGYVLPAYAAVELARQAVARASEQTISPIDALRGATFATVIGPVRFDDGHELADNPFQLQEWRSSGFLTVRPATE
jgi:branched-chain amino acid transport system substrate-binding protein